MTEEKEVSSRRETTKVKIKSVLSEKELAALEAKLIASQGDTGGRAAAQAIRNLVKNADTILSNAQADIEWMIDDSVTRLAAAEESALKNIKSRTVPIIATAIAIILMGLLALFYGLTRDVNSQVIALQTSIISAQEKIQESTDELEEARSTLATATSGLEVATKEIEDAQEKLEAAIEDYKAAKEDYDNLAAEAQVLLNSLEE